jgi:hypothetical protein
MGPARPEIERQGFGTAGNVTKRGDVGAREIGHVDEITLAGSIRRRTICAENLQRRTVSGCGINRKHYEMSLGIVLL